MKKTNTIIIIILIIVGIVLISTASYLIYRQQPKPLGNAYFASEPTDWVEISEETNQPEINVFKATRGLSEIDFTQQDYHTEDDLISFFYHGYYRGEDFQTLYLDKEFYELSEDKSEEEEIALAEKYAVMKIDQDINPNDGVINGLIIGKEENNNFVFYIFVDEDWKQKLTYTNIIWGDSFINPSSLHIKNFDFSKSKNGIYVYKVDTDTDFFQKKPQEGGIMVGELTIDLVQKYWNNEDFDSIFMMLR